MGSHSFETEALLLVLPSTDYQQRVPVAIGTTITDMAVEFIGKFKPENLSKSWKAVCCATQSKWLVQAQPENKFLIRTTKSVTLPPFSTTTIRGCTKLRSHGMRLNLIAEPSNCTQLPASVQCTPTYCTLEPGSNRVSVGVKNISSRAITIPSRVVVGNYSRLGWSLMISPPNLNRTLLGERGFLGFGPTKFGGAQFLDKGAAAISQRFAG